MTTHGAVALVGVLHLRLHAGRAEIHFGADAGVAQCLHHLLVGGDFGLIHDEHDDGAERLRLALRRRAASAACKRETPIEKPVAGTFWPVKRATRSS